ncbi:hypothetical protein JKF63_02933 [Porcisia hertigi]|uniref:Rab-GAP TBC domain-containing protein n=1 Tax=Porcisia hertigi TaxID=2761500 RepID=A0A836I5E7_9TRYP|nr:hypothetical protein JKF63_02933 [Porcisia hertigi]
MYAAFLERILGSPTGDSTSARSGEGPDGGLGSSPGSGAATGSAQYKAVMRPYRCSTNSRVLRSGSVARSATSGDGGGASAYSCMVGGCGSRSFKVGNASSVVFRSSSTSSTQKSTSTAPASQMWGGASHYSKSSEPAPTCSTATLSTDWQCAPGNIVPPPLMATATVTAAGCSEHAQRFQEALRADSVDVALLRKLSWQGCPVALRYEAWMFLTGCWTPQSAARQSTLSRRRIEYAAYIHSIYGVVDWDAVCAMVDSGVDTAVHRSTLKSLEHTAFASQRGGTPMEASLTEMMTTSLGSSLRLFRGTSSTTGGTTATVTKGAVSSPPQLFPHSLPGPQRTLASTEDARLSLQQSTGVSGAQTPSHLLQQQPADFPTEDCPRGALSTPLGSSLRAPAAAGPTGTAEWCPPSPPPSAASSRPAFSTLGLPNADAPPALLAVDDCVGATTGHQVSASTMLGSAELQTLKQIRKDIPRMSGGHCYLLHPRVQASVERILFIWSLRHPACGYVQGMNDLVVPFMGVVLGYRFCPTRSITELHAYTMDMFDEMWSLSAVPVTQWINEVEADVYWMTSYLLNTMQDNYTSSHAGITAMMRHLAAVVQAADPPLYHCLRNVMQINLEQFSFQWMNCLLMRELTETQSLRLLDAYLSDEERRWSVTHVYVCAALLLRWGPQIMTFREDYIGAMKFLQAPPTEQLSLSDMQDVLSEGFLLQSLYEDTLTRLSTTGE